MKHATFFDRAIKLVEDALIDVEEALARGKSPTDALNNAHDCLQLVKTTGQRKDR